MYSRDNSGYSAISHQSRGSIVRSNEPKQTKKNKRVQVWARVRPTAYFAHDLIELLPDGKSINIHMKRDARKGVVNNQILDWSFRMDGIFHNSSQDQVFETVSSEIVTSALDGYNGTMLCYGQTGAGKTFTMTGATENYRHRGIIPRSITQLFREIEDRPEFGITVRISYLEIYNETMFDLLSTLPDSWSQVDQQNMVITENEDGVYVKGLSCHLVQNEEEALNLLFEGETNRAIAAHSLNKISSRSHCIFTVYIETRSRVQSNARYTVSKLNFVDLAGSERLGKTKSEGKTQTEAMYINKSLSFLEQVIIALADRKREHIPFRQSKLTHCLKDSIGGNSNTLLVANIWGEGSQIEETVSTLRFATRMMCVATEPAINEVFDPSVLVKKLQKEIMHLKNELAMHDTLTNRSQVVYDPLSEQQKYEIKQQVRRYLEGSLDEIDIINIRQIQGVFESFREIYQQMEKDVEERLRHKFALIDRTDPAAIAAAQQAGIPITDEGVLVGESDSTGFGVGVAPRSAKAEPSSVVQLRKKEKEKEKKKTGREAKSPVAGRTAGSPAQSTKGDKREGSPSLHTPQEKEKKDDTEDRTSPTSSAGGISKTEKQARPSESSRPSTAKSKYTKSPLSDGKSKSIAPITEVLDVQIVEEKAEVEEEEEHEVGEERPGTPPTRTAAFEEFKQEKGSEINRILIENKEILAKKKQQYAETARGINQTKMDIDKSRATLDRLKEEREANGITSVGTDSQASHGPVYNEDGDVVISEDEFVEIKKLKDQKQKYRTDYEDLKMLKAEVQYCQKLVDQCRQRLIQEFDNWYAENFLNQVEEGPQTSMAAGHGIRPGVFIPFNLNAMPEDEQEKFDRLQTELLMHDPDSAAYYNAKLRTERRKTYETAMSQSQPAYRKPGTPTMRIRNQPPNMLQVQN